MSAVGGGGGEGRGREGGEEICDAEISLVLFEANCCTVGPQSMMCIVHVLYVHCTCTYILYVNMIFCTV